MRASASLLLLAALGLAGCKGESQGAGPPPALPPPASGITGTSFNVVPCLIQVVAPGQTVAILVVPDVLTLDFNRPSIFPNGRSFTDPVVDYTLAFLFLDLTKHPITALHSLPLNPPGNDKVLPAAFPYIAAPHGGAPAVGGGTNFDFRSDPPSAFVRVDRMGMPAIATVVISGPKKVAYNDDSPVDDATFKSVPEIQATLTGLTNALADDFARANLAICATPE